MSPDQRSVKPSKPSVRLEVLDSHSEEAASDDNWGLDNQEERLIEERRKRRQAILEKHQSGSLATNMNAPESSKPVARIIHQSEQTVNIASAVSQHVNHHVDVEKIVEGDAAADYDPMQDKLAEQRRRQAMAHNDTAHIQTAVKPNDELDMFAEDVDLHFDAAQTTTALAADSDSWDDAEGYYRFAINDKLEDKYTVTKNLGKGVFSSVVKAHDQHGVDVAIKVIRNNEIMYKAGIKEMSILEKLASNDPNDKRHVIRLLGHFEHRNHLCLVFESMSINLREVLKKFGRDVGISIKAVRSYAHQILLALTLMQKCNILHADIKPDNILVNESHNIVKVADFGSASDASENELTPYLVSRFYRAPEVILGCPYDFAMDMWSVGCTLFELYTGKILFPGRHNNEMLRLHMDSAGRFPAKMIRRGKFSEQHFSDNNFLLQDVDKITGNDIIKEVPMPATPVRDVKQRVLSTLGKSSAEEAEMVKGLADLLDKMLKLDPAQRISPSEALQHVFFSK